MTLSDHTRSQSRKLVRVPSRPRGIRHTKETGLSSLEARLGKLCCDAPPLGLRTTRSSPGRGLNVSFSEGTQAGSLGRRCCHLSCMSPRRQGKESRLPCPRGHSGFNMLLSPETGFLLKFLLTNRGYTDTVIMKTKCRILPV